MCLEFDFTYAVQISSRSVNPLSYYIYIYIYIATYWRRITFHDTVDTDGMKFIGMYRISASYPVIRPIFNYLVSGIWFVTQLSGIRPDIMLISGWITDNCFFSCNKQL